MLRARDRMRGSHLLVLLCVFCVSFFTLFRQPALNETSRQLSGVASSGVPMSLEWSSDPARVADWRLVAEEEGRDARARAIGGDWSWFETAADLADPFFVGEERRECDVVYGSAIDGLCSYTFHYVAERLERGTGRIVYVRGILRDESSMPVASVANDVGCMDYVGCLAHARLGASVPLPVEIVSSEVGIQEHLQSHWGDPILFDPERLPKLIEAWTQERRHLIDLDAKGEVADVRRALQLRYVKSLVPYLHGHMRRVQGLVDESD